MTKLQEFAFFVGVAAVIVVLLFVHVSMLNEQTAACQQHIAKLEAMMPQPRTSHHH